MKFIGMEKVRSGKYLNSYELIYRNRSGKEKRYEMVSREDLKTAADIGRKTAGIAIAAFKDRKMLLLKEFRMGINKSIFNLCAGMLEDGETVEQCTERELYEETGLSVKRVLCVLPPSYSAVGITDTKTVIVFVEADGEFEDHASENEKIEAGFYTPDELRGLLEREEFSSLALLTACFFMNSLDRDKP